MSTSADLVLQRLPDPINQGSSLTTDTANAVRAGGDVLVKHVFAVTRDGTQFVSIICHIFRFDWEQNSAIRAYRHDHGIPAS
jgi:hypothetical protein